MAVNGSMRITELPNDLTADIDSCDALVSMLIHSIHAKKQC